jgi:hypothetical protein
VSASIQAPPVSGGTAQRGKSGAEVRAALLRGQPTNPALQRLKGRLLSETEASEVITSYDRMHHRHNRS